MGEGEVPRQNLSDPYWRGRWCDRRGCDDGGVNACGVWPLALYRMVLGAVWGDAPDSWLLVRDGGFKVGGGVVGVEEAKLERFAGALGVVSQLYVELLGRFPDVGALLSRAPRLAAQTLHRDDEAKAKVILSDLRHELLGSGERADKLRVRDQLLDQWRTKCLVLSRLISRFHLPLPSSVAACFREDGSMVAPGEGGGGMPEGGNGIEDLARALE